MIQYGLIKTKDLFLNLIYKCLKLKWYGNIMPTVEPFFVSLRNRIVRRV